SQSPHIGPLVYGGHAADHDIARNALGNSGFGSDGYIVTDMQMSGNAYLSGESAIVADMGGAGDTYLRDDEAVSSHLNIMPQLDEIVDFGTVADTRGIENSPVDGGIGSHLDVVADGNATYL